jgi:hypothetical protein
LIVGTRLGLERLGVDQEIRPAIGFGLLLFADLTRQFIWL